MRRMWSVIVLSAVLGLSVTGCMNRGATSTTTACRPTPDLQITAEYMPSKNTVGESQLTGALFNSSLERDYDNVRLKINFYDNAGAQISSQILAVEENIDAGEAEDFTLAFTPPVGTESTDWTIECAVAD